MGYSKDQAMEALQQVDWDEEEAVQLILNS